MYTKLYYQVYFIFMVNNVWNYNHLSSVYDLTVCISYICSNLDYSYKGQQICK